MNEDEKQMFRRDRLEAASVKVGNDAELGRLLGHKSGTQVGHMRFGRRPITEKTIAKLEALPGLAGWFKTPELGSGQPVRAATDEDELESIRVMKLRLKAGVAGFAVEPDEEEDEPIYFRPDWLQRRGFKAYKLIATRVAGHSMEPTLYPGDLVVANTADTAPTDGEVFSVNYEGEPLIKRLKRDAGEWWLSSDNSDKNRYPDKRWIDQNAIIIGRIVHRQSERI